IYDRTMGNLITNASGNYVTIEVNNKIIFSTLESFSNKVEGNEFLSKAVNVGATALAAGAAGFFTAGTGAAAVMSAASLASASTSTKEKASSLTASGGVGGAAVRGAGMAALQSGITSGIRTAADAAVSNETYHQSTFYQLQNKYFYSGRHPIGLEVRFSQIKLNQYLRQKEIKGPLFYDYYNIQHLGDYLNTKENGIYLGDDFYEKKVDDFTPISSKGALMIAPLEKLGEEMTQEELEKEGNEIKRMIEEWMEKHKKAALFVQE
ncbi:20115_t:CDS:2, partial [Cetraspora pellucida]